MLHTGNQVIQLRQQVFVPITMWHVNQLFTMGVAATSSTYYINK
jgi:hypothetical protein